MVPYRGRLSLRIARAALAVGCLASYRLGPGPHPHPIVILLAVYVVFAAGALFERRFDSEPRAVVALVVDILFFYFWMWLQPSGVAGWMGPPFMAYLLSSAILLHGLSQLGAAAGSVVLAVVLFRPDGETGLLWATLGATLTAGAVGFYKRYIERRLSNTMRHNVIIRSQAQVARETERERIAADFHDGPLQSFIGFQMRLEIVKKLMARDMAAAADELRQLQELCQAQVGELRSFVRSMRPADDGASLGASLSRMAEQFQRDTGISASFSGGEFHDPSEIEVSLELIQIVREALHNIEKHSGATRVALTVTRRESKLEVQVQDNGGGFPFSGSFALEELELLRMGPVSIKRRVRMLGGDLLLESRPGHGANLQIRVPV